jgi:hypothetical protein
MSQMTATDVEVESRMPLGKFKLTLGSSFGGIDYTLSPFCPVGSLSLPLILRIPAHRLKFVTISEG